jgi:hypothetical protein
LAGLLDNFGRLFLGLEQGLDSVGLLGRLDGMSESYWDEDRSSIPLGELKVNFAGRFFAFSPDAF